MALYRDEAYEAALVEFLASRDAYPARGNTLNAALCLQRLERHADALTMFESLLREVDELPPDERQLVNREMAALRGRVGTIDVQVVEPDAQVMLDGRPRGLTPLSAPLRVDAGEHLLRLVKAGFLPLERVVAVRAQAQARVAGELRALANAASLTVATPPGSPAVQVLLDGVPVGEAPWSGTVAIGRHTVALAGEGDLGSVPVPVDTQSRKPTTLTLTPEKLACRLALEPRPADARLALDGVTLGLGSWRGKVRCGRHQIEASAAAFLSRAEEVRVAPDAPRRVRIELERDPDAAAWQLEHPPRIVVDLLGLAVVSPSLGGDLDANCISACRARLPLGGAVSVTGGYQLGSGFGFGLSLGYTEVRQPIEERTVVVQELHTATPQSAQLDETLAWRAGLVGASSWLQRGEDVSFTARVSAGVALGAATLQREAQLAGTAIPLGRVARAAHAFFVAPELRLGFKVTSYLRLDVGVQAQVLVPLSDPTWRQPFDPSTPSTGFVDFPAETLLGDAFAVIAPGLGLGVMLPL